MDPNNNVAMQMIREAIARRANPDGNPAGGSVAPAITQTTPQAPSSPTLPAMNPANPSVGQAFSTPQASNKGQAVANVRSALDDESRNNMRTLVSQLIKYL